MANQAVYDRDQRPGGSPGSDLRFPASLVWRSGEPAVRRITTADVWDALSQGFADFRAVPTHVLFAIIVYPVVGLVLYRLLTGENLLPLVYPMLAGFALLGPVAAIGVYELSRRREQGLESSAFNAFDVLRSPSIGKIALLGLMLAAIFFVWVYCAKLLYAQLFGALHPATMGELVDQVTTTSQGWNLFVAGNLIGFAFALVVLMISVVSFPMLVDRSDVSVMTAVRTSVRAALENPVPIALWGLIVAGMLLLGAIPLLIGLTIALPILGHATWHLYRKLVPRDGATLNPN